MKRENFFEGQQTEGNLEQLERRAHNLLNSWDHTAGVYSEKLILEQFKYNIPGVHSEKLKNALTVELQL